jgi:hypothetical protein
MHLFNFEKILLCYLIQVGDFGLKTLPWYFQAFQNLVHIFFGQSFKLQIFGGEPKSKKKNILKLGKALPNVIAPYASHLSNLTHGISWYLYASNSISKLRNTHFKLLFHHLSLINSFFETPTNHGMNPSSTLPSLDKMDVYYSPTFGWLSLERKREKERPMHVLCKSWKTLLQRCMHEYHDSTHTFLTVPENPIT